MKVHELKTWREYYVEIAAGRKTCELRFDDGRDFQVGHHLRLREFDRTTATYTGREVTAEVTHLMPDPGENSGFQRVAINPGWVVMSLRIVGWNSGPQLDATGFLP